ncbi:MAG TPA: N-acetylmuramoyl-L-alanine amidase [Bacillota bacterium]|nr:N-acetylmuramoyl-L-alanine amidase [Bacillota bacterium]
MHKQLFIKRGRRFVVTAAAVLTLLFSCLPLQAVRALEPAQEQLFTQAAAEFSVPKELLLAISYNETRWQSSGDTATSDGGIGLMHLTAPLQVEDGRGDPSRPMPTHQTDGGTYTLDRAAALLHVPADTLKHNDAQNVRGGAAVLAALAKDEHDGTLPADINGWYDAVAQYSTASSEEGRQRFADAVYQTLGQGTPSVAVDGSQHMSLRAKTDLQPHAAKLQQNNGTECPTTVTCHFIPAGYAQNSADPADYGNYDHANRPKDMKIKYIVIHDTEGSYTSAINHFQDTKAYVSCNYIIRSSDGDITQMVRNEDVQWCAGDWYVNMHSINIEHEAFAAQGAQWYTEAMYQSSANLVRYLAKKYNVPLDREHIIGHDNIPTITPAKLPAQHWDPGPYWDWNHYMALLHGVSDQQERSRMTKPQGTQKSVTIAPSFATNQPAIQDCSTGTCTTLPAQGSNAVFLHTQPDAASPLLSDPYLHAPGEPGTNHIDDWGSKASTGKRFAVADRHGDWTAIWYGGTKGWFYNPAAQPAAYPSRDSVLTPKAGKTSIPVYGAAYPQNAADYPSGVPVQTLSPLYNMPAGQSYVTTAEKLPTDYFHDATVDYSQPHDHEIIIGQEKYYQITYNQRIAYVKASDVKLTR